MSTATTKSKVLDVWDWCREIYLQEGRIKLSFPKSTDPVKTYQYRYAHQLAERLAEWEFDEPTSRRFIEIAVAYAKDKGLLHKGLSLMCQSNLLEIARKRLEREQQQDLGILVELQRVHFWVASKIGSRDPVDVMLTRRNPDGHRNLVRWHAERRLSDLYLSLSAPCGRALARLERSSPTERQEVPSSSRLYLARMVFLQDDSNRREAKRIMGGDWRQCP